MSTTNPVGATAFNEIVAQLSAMPPSQRALHLLYNVCALAAREVPMAPADLRREAEFALKYADAHLVEDSNV